MVGENENKVCSKCRLSKNVFEFHLDKTRPDGRRSWCKLCVKQFTAKRPYNRAKHDKFINEHPVTYLLVNAKHRAKKYGMVFNLTEKDITIPKCCPILGIPLDRKISKNNAPSLDRIDSELGYERDNVQVISYRANMLKLDASRDELLRFAEWVNNVYATS